MAAPDRASAVARRNEVNDLPSVEEIECHGSGGVVLLLVDSSGSVRDEIANLKAGVLHLIEFFWSRLGECRFLVVQFSSKVSLVTNAFLMKGDPALTNAVNGFIPELDETNTEAALRFAVRLFSEKVPSSLAIPRHCVVLTDGKPNVNGKPQDLRATAKLLHSLGVVTSAVAVGRDAGVAMDHIVSHPKYKYEVGGMAALTTLFEGEKPPTRMTATAVPSEKGQNKFGEMMTLDVTLTLCEPATEDLVVSADLKGYFINMDTNTSEHYEVVETGSIKHTFTLSLRFADTADSNDCPSILYFVVYLKEDEVDAKAGRWAQVSRLDTVPMVVWGRWFLKELVDKYPGNKVVLTWGNKGNGKSSLIRQLFNLFTAGNRVINYLSVLNSDNHVTKTIKLHDLVSKTAADYNSAFGGVGLQFVDVPGSDETTFRHVTIEDVMEGRCSDGTKLEFLHAVEKMAEEMDKEGKSAAEVREAVVAELTKGKGEAVRASMACVVFVCTKYTMLDQDAANLLRRQIEIFTKYDINSILVVTYADRIRKDESVKSYRKLAATAYGLSPSSVYMMGNYSGQVDSAAENEAGDTKTPDREMATLVLLDAIFRQAQLNASPHISLGIWNNEQKRVTVASPVEASTIELTPSMLIALAQKNARAMRRELTKRGSNSIEFAVYTTTGAPMKGGQLNPNSVDMTKVEGVSAIDLEWNISRLFPGMLLRKSMPSVILQCTSDHPYPKEFSVILHVTKTDEDKLEFSLESIDNHTYMEDYWKPDDPINS